MNTFPTTLNNYTGNETLLAAEHAQEHNALEAKVGADGSAVTTSHDYKLSGVTGTDKAVSKTGIETLTNKTLTSPVINTPTGDVATITGAQTLKNKIINTKSSDGNVFKLNNNTLISPSDEDGEYIFPTANATLVGTSETQTLSNKTLTSPVINTGFSGTAKATASEVATGTNDTKIVTPLSAAAYGNSSMARQAIINGNFDVWQRGTSIALTTADGYTADRWYAETATATTDKTISQQDGTGVEGSRYCLRYLAAQDVDALNTLSQALETQDSIKFRGKKLTLSFYARGGAEFVADNATLVSKIVTGKGTDQKVLAFTTSADGVSQNNTLTTSWVKFTCTTSAVIASDITQIGVSFAFTHAGSGTTTNYFEITQVQLCAGDVALPFQPKSYAQELLDCQRYTVDMLGGSALANIIVATGECNSATRLYASIQPPVTMRIAPTIVAGTASNFSVGYWTGANIACTAMSLNIATPQMVLMNFDVAGGLTANYPARIFRPGTTEKLLFTAEL